MSITLERPSSIGEKMKMFEPASIPHLCSTEELIEAARNGRISIILDDHGPLVQGCLTLPAQFVTPDAVTFMAMEGKGLICLALESARIAELGIEMLPQRHGDEIRQPAFTVSIEAREGISTGISAADRACTMRVAMDRTKTGEDLVSPGHVFPIAAHDAGVLANPGYTEAGIDLARLAGLQPGAVGCRILAEDGEVAELSQLFALAEKHKLCIGRISDLIIHRRRYDHQIECVEERQFESLHGGKWTAHRYRSKANGRIGMVLVSQHRDIAQPVRLMLHDFDFHRDAMGAVSTSGASLTQAMEHLDQTGGAILIDFETDQWQLSPEPTSQVADVGIGAEILARLGLTHVIPADGCEEHSAFMKGGTLEKLGFNISRGGME